jgi:hypothetical protein
MLLEVENFEAWVQAQANFTCCALKYGSCAFVMGSAHVTP